MDVQEIDGERYVVAADLAKATGVNRAAVYQAVRLGKLRSIEMLGRRLILHADAVAWASAPHGDFAATGKSGRRRKTTEGETTNEQ